MFGSFDQKPCNLIRDPLDFINRFKVVMNYYRVPASWVYSLPVCLDDVKCKYVSDTLLKLSSWAEIEKAFLDHDSDNSI